MVVPTQLVASARLKKGRDRGHGQQDGGGTRDDDQAAVKGALEGRRQAVDAGKECHRQNSPGLVGARPPAPPGGGSVARGNRASKSPAWLRRNLPASVHLATKALLAWVRPNPITFLRTPRTPVTEASMRIGCGSVACRLKSRRPSSVTMMVAEEFRLRETVLIAATKKRRCPWGDRRF